MSVPTIYREALLAHRCATPGCKCTTVDFSARCHPSTGVRLVGNTRTGLIDVLCGRCLTPVATIVVAARPPEAQA